LRDLQAEADRREEKDSALRTRQQEMNRLLAEGKAHLDLAMACERREMLIMASVTDSVTLRQTLAAQRAHCEEAIGCYKQALMIDNSFIAHAGLASAASKIGRYDEAIEHGVIALKGAPESWPLSYPALLRAYDGKARNNPGEAGVKYLREAAALMEQYVRKLTPPALHYHKVTQAQCYVEIGDRLAGAERIEEYVKAINLIEAHLASYPDLDKDKDEEVVKSGKMMEVILATLKIRLGRMD
jgi:tetratricopeptide (TPR) repeat protein